MIILLDANVWISERLLRSSVGAALLFAIKKAGAQIALPRVTKLEIENGVVRDGSNSVAAIGSAFSVIRALLGVAPELELPGEVQFRLAVENRLVELKGLIRDIEHTPDHLERALSRVLQHRPPAHKREEFRDALLWEIALDLAKESEVHLITNDGAFYQDGKVMAAELSEQLVAECTWVRGDIRAFPNVERFIEFLGSGVVAVDEEELKSAVRGALEPELAATVSDFGGVLGELQDARIEAFLTERHDNIAVSYDLVFAFRFPTEPGALGGTAQVSGSANYSTESRSLDNVQVSTSELVSETGDPLRRNARMYVRGLSLGELVHTPYTLRRKLPLTRRGSEAMGGAGETQ